MQTFAGPGTAAPDEMADRELPNQPRGVTRRLVAQALLAGAQATTPEGDAVAADLEATSELPDDVAPSLGIGEFADLWSGETVSTPVNGRLTVSVPGWGFRILVPGDV